MDDQEYPFPVLRPLLAKRAKCIECSGFNITEVRECTVTDCANWPYRFGTKPKGVTFAEPWEYWTAVRDKGTMDPPDWLCRKRAHSSAETENGTNDEDQ